jgi:hypothetical protein
VRPRRVVAFALVLGSLLPFAGARAAIPVPWVPANAGVLWYQPNDASYPLSPPRQPPGEASGAWWLTRRIGSSPLLAGVMHLGSFFNGLYASAGGGAWASVTPGCWLPPDPPSWVPPDGGPSYRYARRVAVAATGLDVCGIEGLAYDPVLPNRMYAAAYDVVSLKGSEPTLGDGGVYVSDDLGVSWTKLAGGFRGNGLAVARDGNGPATIVAGYIQRSNGATGETPGGGSLSVSNDDGRSWRAVALPASGCADAPATSQRITPSIAFNPRNAREIFAGTNAGLYVSRDAGATWAAARILCGGVWGIAFSPDGTTVYTGDANGVVSRAPASTLAFAPIADLGVGKVQSLLLDQLTGTTLYAAMWSGADANVFRVPASGGSARLDDSLLRDVVPLDQRWPAQAPKPFPLAFDDGNGAAAPSLFLAQLTAVPGPLYVSTIFRGVFARAD